ncbi:MAG: hypothetical protein RMK57_03610 [Bryobacterales bacterium]|nr:hypothetical protein [Bryobacteraceae bacterium]MDW8353595.1 hypothetical protein [Bryobacterales bacterium]
MDELTAAIVGVHELDWLEDLRALAGSHPAKVRKVIPECVPDAVRAFFAWWTSLDRQTALAWWRQAEVGEADGAHAAVLRQLRARASTCAGAEAIRHALRGEEGFLALSEWSREKLAQFAGGAAWPQLHDALPAARALGERIYQHVPLALERVLERETARRASQGRLDESSLAELLAAPQLLTVQLPFLRRREWARRREALAAATVTVAPDGAIVVSRPGDAEPAGRNLHQALVILASARAARDSGIEATGRICFWDERTVSAGWFESVAAPTMADCGLPTDELCRWVAACAAPAGDEIATSLTLSIPASAAASWGRSPSEKDPAFLPTYTTVSTAVQKALRTWLPYLYFAQPDRYRTPAGALPMLVYAASQPFSGKSRGELTYDVLNPQSMALFFRTAARHLAAHLERVSRALRTSGAEELAASYRPQRAAQLIESQAARPRAVMRLLAAEAWIIDHLVNFGCKLGRERDGKLDPVLVAEKLVIELHARLRKLHGGQDFFELVPLILMEATCALSRALGEAVAPEVVVRLRLGESAITAVAHPSAAATA